MTDDQWRRGRGDDEDDAFGPPLFSDEPTGSGGAISFGDSDTGPLPHWTQPPTGEIPRVLSSGSDATDDLDVWSSFSGQSSPAWRDERGAGDHSGGLDDITGLSPVFEHPDDEPAFDQPEPAGRDESAPVRREPGRITIGTDPTDGAGSRPAGARRGTRPGDPGARGARPSRGPSGRPAPQRSAPAAASGRDLPTAIAVGLAIAAVFLGVLLYAPAWAVAGVVVLVLGLAAAEYFDRVREKGYQPAFAAGVMACVMAPIAVYNYGPGSLAVVLFLAFAAAAVTFIGANGLESNPMPNMAITTLGIVWIGVLGSFGAAIVAMSTVKTPVAAGFASDHIGTDTLCLLAIAVVANDVGAYFIGSKVGRTPLRHWISPNKSVEGLVGGTVFTLAAMFVVGISDRSSTWNSTGDLLLLGLVVAIAAPIGDLTESMFKRNLDVKDFGSIVKGHGGMLDRFDGFLFALPAVYFLLVTVHPWVTK